MITIADQFGIKEALKQLGIEAINEGTSTGESNFANGKIIESYSPADGALIGKVKTSSKEDYEKAMQKASEAFLEWRMVPAPKRGDIVRQMGDELRKFKEPLGKLVSYEMGKSLQEGYGEVQEMIDICDFAVGLSRQLYGLTMHSERPLHRMYEQYHPIGTVGIISAFNFPVAVWSWNAMIAWVCGDVAIWKPSSKVPLCGIACQNIIKTVLKRNNVRMPGVADRTVQSKRCRFRCFVCLQFGCRERGLSGDRTHAGAGVAQNGFGLQGHGSIPSARRHGNVQGACQFLQH